jgi:ABC-type sugar transport system ATPase subunit
LAFATAISVDPEILIIDEALTVGDIFFQQKCMDHMKKLMQACTILLVSHDTHSVTNLCNRVLVLDHGNVLYEGEPVEGVTQYTKIMQNEQFTRKGRRKRVPEDILHHNIPDRVLAGIRELAPDFDTWVVVNDDKRSGECEVSILRAVILKNNSPVVTVQQGELLTIRLFICAAVAAVEIIFGYTVKDRIGNAVFGENTLSLDEKAITLAEGFSLVEYSFVWPEVFPWEYTITVGIGEGTLPLGHVVQCWAHDIFSLSAVTPGKVVHGMFNNRLESIAVQSV